MILSRRNKLNIDGIIPSHAGLWLDKYLSTPDKTEINAKRDLVKCAAEINTSDPLYAAFYKRWEQMLQAKGITPRKAKVKGRMVVGLGAESVLETSVALHRTYGVPYIPGSALKGLAAAYAHQRLTDPEWRKATEKTPIGKAHQILFGDTTTAGYVTFYDALYIPPDTGYDKKALHPDVITVHHPKYYQGGQAAPADWDSPTPIPFLSATGSYLIALSTSPGAEAWLERAYEILGLALAEMGIGAKTSSGYGRMELEPPPVDPGQAKAEKLLAGIDKLPLPKVANELEPLVNRWRQLEASEALKRQVAQALLDKVRDAKREKKSSGKRWYQELVSYVGQGSQ